MNESPINIERANANRRPEGNPSKLPPEFIERLFITVFAMAVLISKSRVRPVSRGDTEARAIIRQMGLLVAEAGQMHGKALACASADDGPRVNAAEFPSEFVERLIISAGSIVVLLAQSRLWTTRKGDTQSYAVFRALAGLVDEAVNVYGRNATVEMPCSCERCVERSKVVAVEQLAPPDA